MTPNAQFVNIVVGFNKSKNKLQSIRKLKKNQQQKKTKQNEKTEGIFVPSIQKNNRC